MKKIISALLCLFCFASCGNNAGGSADYMPYDEIPADYSLEDAKSDGLAVYENSDITSGQSVWNEFVRNAESGKPCFIRLAFYYTLGDPSQYAPEYYEEIKDDYPLLYIQDLSFDGNEYALFSKEDGEEYAYKYKYLKRLEETDPPDNALYSKCVRYVLVNDDSVNSWEQIMLSMLSSQSGVFIDHKTVYSDYTFKE